MHAGLKESEKELSVIQKELRDIDQLDDELLHLEHVRLAADQQLADVSAAGAAGSTAVVTTSAGAGTGDKLAIAQAMAKKEEAHRLEVLCYGCCKDDGCCCAGVVTTPLAHPVLVVGGGAYSSRA